MTELRGAAPDGGGRAARRLPRRARRLARRGAAADRRRAGARRRRARGQAPRAGRRRADRRTSAPEARRSPRSPPAPFAVAYEDEHLLVVDKPAGVVVHPRAATGRARSCRRSPAASPAGDDPERAGRRAPARPRHVRPARARAHARRCTPRCRRSCARAEITREYLALVEGRPAARARDDRRAARPRPPRAHADLDRHRRAARRRSRTSRPSARCPDDTLLRVRARDRPHAPDPRAPAGDRPPGGRRPRVRHARARSGSSASSCTPSALAFAHPVTGAADRRALAAAGGPRSEALRQASGERAGPPEVGEAEGRPVRSLQRRRSARTCPKLFCDPVIDPGRRRHRPSRGRGPCPAHRAPGPRDPRRPGCITPHHKGVLHVAEVGIKELLEAGVHFGHQTRRWNPKMRRFIFGERGGIYIIDLLKTAGAARAGAAVRRPRSPTAAAPCCSSAPRSRPATASRRSPRRPACRTSTTAGSAAC